MTIDYEVSGAGSTVVLLHAGVCDRRMWGPQARDLADAGYRVVLPDLCGFGRTPAPVHPQSDADDVIAVLTELGIERTALVGASYGGAVAAEIAARFPARVGALVLLSSALATHEPSSELRAFAAREDDLLEAGDVDGAVELNVATWLGPEADEQTRDDVRRMQRRAFDLQLHADEVEEIEHEFDPGTIVAPTLVVSGAHDLVDFGQIADELGRRIGDARREQLDWAGHLPTLERAREGFELVRGFLDDVWGRTADRVPGSR
ncbi:MAG: alpha/beta fold hydrolase [Nocardioidaceae bacterium]